MSRVTKAGLQWDDTFATWPEVQLSRFLDNFEPGTTTETMANLVSRTYLAKEEEDYYIETGGSIFEEGDGTSPSYYLKDSEISALQCTSLTETQQEKFTTLLHTNAKLFARDLTELGQTNVLAHVIDTGTARPMKQIPYRAAPKEQEFIKEEIDRMLKNDLIRPSTSAWASPVVVVKKKNGKLRFCVDFRKLNSVTNRDSYPLPRIDDLIDTVGNATWFSSLDLASGYWQVQVHPADVPKTAFTTKYGLFEFKVMPFGLCNAPATFQRLMDHVLGDINRKFALVYIDDIIIFSQTFEEHLAHIEEVMKRIKAAGLRLNFEKCEFVSRYTTFLGHIIGKDGVKPDPTNIEKIKNHAVPVNVTQLKGFLGLAGYYRKFIRGFSSLAEPLNQLMRKDEPYIWLEPQQKAFNTLKDLLISEPILIRPDFDKPFILYTDASNFGLGAVLAQEIEKGKEGVINYLSKSLNRAERNYSATEKEALAAVWGIKKNRCYLLGSPFKLVTDHKALKWLFNQKDPVGRVARWIDTLADYKYEIEYRKGSKHQNADTLSRLPELQ